MSKKQKCTSHQYPIILEYYQNIIEMIDWWTFDRENEKKGKFKKL